MSKESDLYLWLGLAQRAGKVVSGDFALVGKLRKGEGKLLIVAEDCGRNNREKYIHLAEREGLKWIEFGTRDGLGQAIGKEHRAALLLMDAGFAEGVEKRLTR